MLGVAARAGSRPAAAVRRGAARRRPAPVCGRCLVDPPAFGRLRAAAPYRGAARGSFSRSSSGARTSSAPRLARGRWRGRLAPADARGDRAPSPRRDRAGGRAATTRPQSLGAAVAGRLGLAFRRRRLARSARPRSRVASRPPARAATCGAPSPCAALAERADPSGRRRGDLGRDRARVRPRDWSTRSADGHRLVLRARLARGPRRAAAWSFPREALNRLIVRTLPLVPKFVVRRIASRYVAGETLERRARRRARVSTPRVHGDARRARRGRRRASRRPTRPCATYERALVDDRGARLDSNISVKLTRSGPEARSRALPARSSRGSSRPRARPGTFVRIDMEDSSVTEETASDLPRVPRSAYPRVGLVLQAYLRRSADDAARAAAVEGNVRVCKGIYVEPPSIAFQDREEIRRSYVRAGRHPALEPAATSGSRRTIPLLVERSLDVIDRLRSGSAARPTSSRCSSASPATLRRRLVARGPPPACLRALRARRGTRTRCAVSRKTPRSPDTCCRASSCPRETPSLISKVSSPRPPGESLGIPRSSRYGGN